MNLAFALAIAFLGVGPASSASAETEGHVTKEQAARIQKAAKVLHKVANVVEENASNKGLRKTHYWADRVGDLADGLEDEAGDLIRDGGGRDDEVRHTLGQIFDAYTNDRNCVVNLPDGRDRKSLLKGTLKAYRELYEAICGPEPVADDAALAPPKPSAEDSD
jgi:hypothetical protein